MGKVLQLRLGKGLERSDQTKTRKKKKKVWGENQNGSETTACRLTRMW